VSGQQHALAALYPWERPGTRFTGGTGVGTAYIMILRSIKEGVSEGVD